MCVCVCVCSHYFNASSSSSSPPRHLGKLNLSEIYLAGVRDALDAHAEGEAAGIKAHFRMDESGLLTLDFSEAVFEYEQEEESTLSSEGTTPPTSSLHTLTPSHPHALTPSHPHILTHGHANCRDQQYSV